MKHLHIDNEPATELAVSTHEQLIDLLSRFVNGEMSQDEYVDLMQSGLQESLDLCRSIDEHYGPQAEEVELPDVINQG